MKNIFKYIIIVLIFSALSACKKDEGEIKVNQAPNTQISVEAINLSGDRRLNTIVHLTWYGSDPDGYVVGYEISYDQVNWTYTTKQDSTFKFSINSGSDTTDIDLYVRAIDNENQRDPSPDYLKVPIKNTAPSISFDAKLTIADTAFLVATTAWSAQDIDGIETITKVMLSINGKTWYELNKSKKTFSILPSDPITSDTTSSYIYYDSDKNPSSQLIEGLVVNDTNRLYIKAIDQAGTESKIDSSNTFYLKGKKNDILVVGGVTGNSKSVYTNSLTNVGVQYDFLDLLANNGLYQPKVWNITFRLQLEQYDKLFFYSDETIFKNPYTNLSAMLLEFSAASLQNYANDGGKYLISTKFNHNQTIDVFVGVLPIASVSTKNYGSARLYSGDSIVTTLPNYPNLSTNTTISGVGVYNIDSADTEVLYTANVVDGRPTKPWNDTKIIASGRRVGGKLNQIYFGMQLWQLYDKPERLEALFNQIFNVEFN
ncbi:MAG: hypothetical protein HND54_07170 [Bacteroidetes bacterium]|nr:hypothetical protein [Bacteroidota bacterium]